MESINIVIDDYNDFARISEEDKIVSLTKEVETQVDSDSVIPNVTTLTVHDFVTTNESGIDDARHK